MRLCDPGTKGDPSTRLVGEEATRAKRRPLPVRPYGPRSLGSRGPAGSERLEVINRRLCRPSPSPTPGSLLRSNHSRARYDRSTGKYQASRWSYRGCTRRFERRRRPARAPPPLHGRRCHGRRDGRHDPAPRAEERPGSRPRSCPPPARNSRGAHDPLYQLPVGPSVSWSAPRRRPLLRC